MVTICIILGIYVALDIIADIILIMAMKRHGYRLADMALFIRNLFGK